MGDYDYNNTISIMTIIDMIQFSDSVINSVTYEVLNLVLDDDMVSTERPLHDKVRFSVFFLGIGEGTFMQCK